jgi:hypothetical protein
MKTSSDGRCTGSVRSRTASTRLKIAAFTPMPRATETMATTANAGSLARPRTP